MTTRRSRFAFSLVVAMTLLCAALLGCKKSSSSTLKKLAVLEWLDAPIGRASSMSTLDDDDARGGVIAHAWNDRSRAEESIFGTRWPMSANGEIELGFATRNSLENTANGDSIVRLTHEDLLDAPLSENDRGQVLYSDVAPSTDLVVRASADRIEWLYLLNDAAAKTDFTIDVALPNGIPAAHVEEDRSLVFLDPLGVPRFVLEPPYARDANGSRSNVALAWDGARIHVSLHAKELAFPIAIGLATSRIGL